VLNIFGANGDYNLWHLLKDFFLTELIVIQVSPDNAIWPSIYSAIPVIMLFPSQWDQVRYDKKSAHMA